MSSLQSSLSKTIGGEGLPRYIGNTTPLTGDFYLISFSAISQIGHLYAGNGVNLTGQSFPAGYVIGGKHSVVHLNSGSAIVYGDVTGD